MNKESFLFVFELFQKYLASKDYFGPEDEYCFLLLFLQAIIIVFGKINGKAKSVIVFPIILFSWGIEGDS